MGTLLTLAFFVSLTVTLIVVYMKRQPRQDAPPPPSTHPCPRCRKEVPDPARICPFCGVPQQIFELASARIAESDGSGGGAMHALVRKDVCVGCSTCVDACPEPGAIQLVGKLATVDRNVCVGHGECVAACPVGAIALSGGDAVQRIEVPLINTTFESNLPGVYIVGELGGRGLIKNAVNEGKVAVENIARKIAGSPRPNGDTPAVHDVAIVGSGPAGLSAGLQALRSDLDYVILEQGNLADTIRKYPRHKFLLAEPVRIPLYGDLWVADASKESLLHLWEAVIANTGLQVRTSHRVENLAPHESHVKILTDRGEFRARNVVLAMGRRGTPRRLDVPGEELDKVFYDIVEMEAFEGRRVLVVGGGDSAVESALGLANQSGATVHLSYRGSEFKRVKERNREKLERARAAGKVQILLGSQVKEIRSDAVVLQTAEGERTLPNHDVIVRIGGVPPYEFLERIGVRIVQKDVPIAGGAA